MGLRRQLPGFLAIFAACGLMLGPAIPDEGRVDVALALAVDVSYSVDSFEHKLQMEGFAQALQSDEVMKAIRSGGHQRIAVMVYQWSDADNQQVIVPWTVIASAGDAARVGRVLSEGGRIVREGGTAISAALVFGAAQLDRAPAADRRVIDLATDGRNNIGRPAPVARDLVVAQGITINGLAISNEWKELASYLERQVIGGNLSFVEDAKSYDDFGATMLRKLVREITGPGVT
jgi:Protein of unknown function (DUF1194)